MINTQQRQRHRQLSAMCQPCAPEGSNIRAHAIHADISRK